MLSLEPLDGNAQLDHDGAQDAHVISPAPLENLEFDRGAESESEGQNGIFEGRRDKLECHPCNYCM